ncbi:MAG: hypothetical protein MJ223_02790 [Mycoplasmoidaceae bacterium]|nr:hypothetical protein [Mycoplasmoidaceae bacterium]
MRNFIVNPRFRKIFLIDPENEYTNAIKNFDGDVLDCSGLTKDSGHINPFQIFVSGSQNEKDESSDNFNNWQQHFFFLENFFQSLVNSDNSHREWDSATIGVLSKIVIQVYKDKKIYPTSDFKKVSANK